MNGAQNDTQQMGYQQVPPGPAAGPQEPRGGYPPRPDASVPRKSPLLATLFSLMPGLGQVYVGYYAQGFTIILIAAGAIALLNMPGITMLEPFLGTGLGFFWLYNMIDANRRAHHFNRVASGLGGEPVPDDFKLPGARGSLTGGVILIVMGILAILDLNFNVSLDWIEDWWPLILIVFGVQLIYKARRRET